MSDFGTQFHSLSIRKRLAAAALTALAVCTFAPAAQAQQFNFTTVDFGTTGTFLTGIRGDNITGNYVIPGETGGLLYSQSTGVFAPFPIATASGANYPGAIGSSPYGPSFGTQFGILRAVGSFQTQASAPYDMGYMYDGAAAPGAHLTTLAYPSTPGAQTLFTIAHSTFGNQVVGNYDTQLATGNAFIYTINTGTFATNNFPGSVSTTAYGVWGNKIAGGYSPLGSASGLGLDRAYIYDQTTGVWTTYSHPGAVFTHFEGITGAGRAGEYNLVADWAGPDGVLHAAVLHLDANGNQTWIDYAVPGATLTSANSIYGNEALGISVINGVTNGYTVSIPGIYNPIHNVGPLDANTPNVPALSGTPGDDIVNDGTIRTFALNSSGIRSDTYGVVTNNGTIAVTGAGSAGVELNGLYGTLLNAGTITAATGADAIRTGPTAVGTTIVNTGVIDGRVAVTAGADTRFENSGLIGISAPGAGVTHLIDGTFVQTSAGVLVLRVGANGTDALRVNGVARLAGTEVTVFQPGSFLKSYTILSTTAGYTGRFDTFNTVGLPSFLNASLGYTATDVTLNLASAIALSPGLSRNQSAVGGALDNAFNLNGNLNFAGTFNPDASLPGGLGAIFTVAPSQLPGALNALSGEVHASTQSVLLNQALFVRQAVLGRLLQISYAGRSGPEAAFGFAGPSVAALDGTDPSQALAYDSQARRAAGPNLPLKAPPPPDSYASRITYWAQGFGAWGSIDANANASHVSETFAGVISGADVRLANNWRAGFALGYTHADTQIGALASTAQVDAGLIAAYAATSFGAWNVRAGATYAFNSIDTTRSIVFPGFNDRATANYNGGTGQVFGELGYGMAWGAVALEPFGGLAWVHLNTNGFTENGGVAALVGAGRDRDVGYSSLGVRAAVSQVLANGMVLTPRASVAWQYAFGDVTPDAALAFAGLPGANFTVTGVPIARNAALVDAGAELRISPQAKIGLFYSAQLASSARDNAIKGNFVWNF